MPERIGPTGESPDGAITAGDRGELKIEVGIHEPN
jgi:hypothetical protein